MNWLSSLFNRNKEPNSMTSLREALRAAETEQGAGSASSEASGGAARLEEIVRTYNSRVDQIDPEIRAGVFKLLSESLDLAEACALDHTPASEVLNNVLEIMAASQSLMVLFENSKPQFSAYAIRNTQNGEFLPGLFYNTGAALAEIQRLRNLGATAPLEVLPVKIASEVVIHIPGTLSAITSEPQRAPHAAITEGEYEDAPQSDAAKKTSANGPETPSPLDGQGPSQATAPIPPAPQPPSS